jgi:hypothetical protein
MKQIYYLLLPLLLMLVACKKDSVDGSSIKNFQSSVNDMASSLTTLEQTKFNEALYILKTYAVEGEGDLPRLEALAKLIDQKKVPEIFALADETAKKHNIEWESTGPPSLGDMDIFQNITASERDYNDITASSLDILVKPMELDSLGGARALRIIPKLMDDKGNPVEFSNAALQTTMEVYSNGNKLLTSKNVMTGNDFKGFYLKLTSLPANKIVDSSIDIKVSVKTTKKTYQLMKSGVSINSRALKPASVSEETPAETPENTTPKEEQPEKPVNTEKPEVVINKFLNNIGSQNLKAAYDVSDNPSWGSYDKFSNPNSGFGTVKNLNIKSVSTKSATDKKAAVDAVYQVIDKDGNTTLLNVSYGLKRSENGWKISSYKINSSEKQKN